MCPDVIPSDACAKAFVKACVACKTILIILKSRVVEEVHLVKLKKCASEIGELLKVAFSGIADVTYLQWS